MTAVLSDFDSTMAEKIVVDTVNNTVDVTFRSTGTTYRFALSNAEISDIVTVTTARSKGKLLHQLLDIRNGVLVPDASVVSNVATPNVAPKVKKTVAKASVKNAMTTAKVSQPSLRNAKRSATI